MSAGIPLHIAKTNDAVVLAPDVSVGTAAVVGNFDGVHLGHQALFAKAAVEAKARGLVPVALTFDPHPSVVLGKNLPGMLTTLAQRAELLARLGAVHVFVRRFDLPFSTWSPERFAEELIVGELRAKVVVSGKNFRFGKDRAGDSATLLALGERLGFTAFSAEAKDARGAFSSTRARDAVLAGDLAEAEAILGRRHSIEGRVLTGDQRGRTLGFPTANLDPSGLVLPPNGVYAVGVDLVAESGSRALARGVMNIGVRPTVATEGSRTVEVHLFDLAQDLYGETLRAHLVRKIRDEQRFPSLDALKEQIALDASEARAVTETVSPTRGTYG
jgi:riboflavin kinase/FMN adenylyltransferase